MSAPLKFTKIPSSAAGSGNFNTLVAASVVGAVALACAVFERESLSCLVTTLADTNTLTLTPVWQVSDDESTWSDVTSPQGAAQVIQSTGTAGADTAISRVYIAPPEVRGWRFVRMAIRTGVVTGATGDTYAFEYHYVRNGFANS